MNNSESVPGLQTAVAVFIFRRPDTTAKVLQAIAQSRPLKLLVVADGPRDGRAGEAELCEKTRGLVDQIDFGCEVIKHYATRNLGLRERMVSGLDWVFSQVEEAILLEDDCLPDASFFPFCEQMLERYRHEPRVMMISGDNFLLGQYDSGSSYYFSRYAHIWGWASWRRAWQLYDASMSDWPQKRGRRWLESVMDSAEEVRHWKKCFDATHSGQKITWDYQWSYRCMAEAALIVMPQRNLVVNIGAGSQATNTFDTEAPAFRARLESLSFPLIHPESLARDVTADRLEFQALHARPPAWTRFFGRLQRSVAKRLGRVFPLAEPRSPK